MKYYILIQNDYSAGKFKKQGTKLVMFINNTWAYTYNLIAEI